jgi:RNA polymerase sigma-70 factor (ECF subfamily)
LPQTSTAEAQLAHRARDGDADALTELYQRYRHPLYSHAWRMLRDRAAAQDIVQEAFARAIAGMSRTRERGELRFKAWIFRIATNLCLKHLTRNMRWSQDERRVAEKPSTSDPETGRRRTEIAAHVAAALEDLPPRYRQILLLRELDELSYDELAEVLGLDRGRVKVTLHRARARFAALFIANQLLSSPSNTPRIQCGELAALIPTRDRKQLVAHLERCSRCRQREHRPAGELFALLPPVPAPTLPAPTPPVLAPLGSAAQASTPWLWVGAAAAVPVAVATVVLTLSTMLPGNVGRAATRPGPEKRRPTARALTTVQPPTVQASTIQTPTPQASTAAVTTPRLAPRARVAAATARRPSTPRTAARLPMRYRVKLRLIPGTAAIERGGKVLAATEEIGVHPGDRVRVRPGHAVGLLLPGDQWLIVEGRLRLDRLHRSGREASGPVRLTLLSGRLLAQATTRGGGLEIRLGCGSRCTVAEGELRLRLSPAGRVALDVLHGYARVSGAHPTRLVPPGTHLEVEPGDVGFARRLLPAARELRPVAAVGEQPPLLTWKPVPTASSYSVRVARDAQFMELERTLQVAGPGIRPGPLPPGKHFWQVVAHGGASDGRPSKIYSFDVAARR